MVITWSKVVHNYKNGQTLAHNGQKIKKHKQSNGRKMWLKKVNNYIKAKLKNWCSFGLWTPFKYFTGKHCHRWQGRKRSHSGAKDAGTSRIRQGTKTGRPWIAHWWIQVTFMIDFSACVASNFGKSCVSFGSFWISFFMIFSLLDFCLFRSWLRFQQSMLVNWIRTLPPTNSVICQK